MTINPPAKGGCWRVDEITGALVADVAAPAPIEIAPPPTSPPAAPDHDHENDQDEESGL